MRPEQVHIESHLGDAGNDPECNCSDGEGVLCRVAKVPMLQDPREEVDGERGGGDKDHNGGGIKDGESNAGGKSPRRSGN